MRQDYDLICIQSIHDGFVFYESNGSIQKIDVIESAKCWWDKHNKANIIDLLRKRRTKNIYAGDKFLNLSQPYIRFYQNNDEIIFTRQIADEVESSDACEFLQWWEGINTDLNHMGYWLFDEG